ncbi:MAG: thiamine diphosphokinase [Erysipelotrichaceae bacterium]|nr:thiamine diphosphokinase [Erysipelotrichaceae bacterium]
MLKTCMLVCPLAKSIPDIKCDYFGIDAGAYTLASHKIMMERSIGDFDSLDEKYLQQIDRYSIKMVKLNPIKDKSDLEEGIDLALSLGYDKIYIVGASGGRLDHQYANFQLLKNTTKAKVIFLDAKNRLEVFTKGTYDVAKSVYKYFSIFALDDSVITLEGFKYPLKYQPLTNKDIYTLSNEILDTNAKITVHQGRVIIIQAND